jgi:hypothetical protein
LSGKLNWDKAASQERVVHHGGERMEQTPLPHAKVYRPKTATRAQRADLASRGYQAPAGMTRKAAVRVRDLLSILGVTTSSVQQALRITDPKSRELAIDRLLQKLEINYERAMEKCGARSFTEGEFKHDSEALKSAQSRLVRMLESGRPRAK